MANLTSFLIDNRYLVYNIIGEGGMAIVYRAKDKRLERDVAIKVIKTYQFTPTILKEYVTRFDREAKILAKFSHPNINTILDYGEHEGAPYIVMHYLPDGTLKQAMKFPLLWRDVFNVLLPITRGLEYAHQQGIIHRDINLSNIMIGKSGEPVLTDFGIAKSLLTKDSYITKFGVIIGTPAYMAPEQGTGADVDARTDIYALGVVLYEMVTGQLPYEPNPDDPRAVLRDKIVEPLPDPREFIPDLPTGVIDILYKALAIQPKDRYQSTKDFSLALENLLKEKNTGVSPDELFKKATKLNIKGYASRAIQLYKQVRDIDPYYPNIDLEIMHLEEEIAKGFLDSNDKVSKDKIEEDREIRSKNTLVKTFRRGVAVAILLVLIGIVITALPNSLIPAIWPTHTSTPTETPLPTTTATLTATITTTATQTQIPTPANWPDEILIPSGEVMRLVPAAEFTMGSYADTALAECQKNRVDNDCQQNSFTDEEPPHRVYLDGFYIDKYEVTNALYGRCVEADECQPPKEIRSSTRSSYYGNPIFDDYPVIYVNWKMAKAYCEWRGARLPTEAEWEKAARGTDGRTYPWGEDLDCDHANYGQNATGACEGDTTLVGNYENGQSVYGIYDMAGNVSEWVEDWYQFDYYATLGNNIVNPQGPNSGSARVTRGGSWNFEDSDVRSANRNGFGIATYSNYIGFRCAKDP